ncbi:MAG: choline kinase family protein [Actinomycetia bacterium]|nr:choline kinase family protein [Actinomycetes bacterium]
MAVVLPTDEPVFSSVVARVPALSGVQDLVVRTLEGGLTNANYLVEARGERFVVRIVGDNGDILVNDRTTEEAAMRRAVSAGISPELIVFVQPEGHIVTRYLEDATPLTISQFVSDAMIPRLAARLKQVHGLESIDGSFDPYADIWRWLGVLDERGTDRPSRLASLLERVASIEHDPIRNDPDRFVLCHNDPYHLNFLDDGSLWLIDWEYAGMGDMMYDIASVAYVLDRRGKDLLLESYFGSVDTPRRLDLDASICVVLCWNVVWSLIQTHGGVTGFDYLAYAEELLDTVPMR